LYILILAKELYHNLYLKLYPHWIIDPAAVTHTALRTAAALTRILPDGPGEAEFESLLSRPKKFIWVYRNLTPRQREAVEALGIPGFALRYEEGRSYPTGRLMGHVVFHHPCNGCRDDVYGHRCHHHVGESLYHLGFLPAIFADRLFDHRIGRRHSRET